MNYPSPRNPEEEPPGPEPERLFEGEIDLTGAVHQDQALVDVIGDAITEAEDDGVLPEWGARTLARALANARRDPFSGALHHYAVTGRIDAAAIVTELAALSRRTADDAELQEWINWLGITIIARQDSEHPAVAEHGLDTRSAHHELGVHLLFAFGAAEAAGTTIRADEAMGVATLLTALVGPESQMARFARTGDAHPALLHDECQQLHQLTELAPGLRTWIVHLQQHLAARTDLGRGEPATGDADLDELPAVPDPADAFRAYLQLPDAGPDRDSVLLGFHSAYLHAVASDAELAALVPDELADEGMSEAERARLAYDAWDIVEINGVRYLFAK